MHRFAFLTTIALAAAACGDDTGGSGSGGGSGTGTGGAGTGTGTGTGTDTGTGTGTGTTGVTVGTGTSTGTGGAGGADPAFLAACESADAAQAPISDELACETGLAALDCDALAIDYEGCETEATAYFDCYATEITVEDCVCEDGLAACTPPAACQAELDAFSACAF